MKKFTVLLFFALCFGWLAQSQPQWGFPQDFGINYSTRFNTFSFIDEDTGWLSGNFGVIWKTTDGGVSWTPQATGTARYLNGIHFVSETHGWAAGEAGTILGTTNGGSTWTTQLDLGGTNHLNSIFFSSNTSGWAVGNGGRVMNTTDGGENWTQITGLPVGTNILRSIFFVNETHGWIVGNGGTIIGTTDGGETWDAQSSGVTSILYTVNFANSTHGWVVGAGGVILATTDGGQTWEAQDSGITTNLNSVSFASATKGWAAGNNGVVLATVDGGETWVAQETNVGAIINAIAFVSETKGLAAGQAGLLMTTADGGSNWEGIGYGTASALNSIYFASNDTGYFVGAGGTIMKTTNGGLNWIYDFNTAITTTLNSVHFPTPDKGWIVGHNAVILHKSEGKDTWVQQNAPDGFTTNLISVFFVNETHGWAVGQSGGIVATTNGGETWIQQSSGLGTTAINSVFFANQTHGWAVGASGKIISTTNGGDTWVEQTANAGTNILRSVFFVSETQGWVVGNGGTIRTTIDGGENWTTQDSGLGNILYSVFFVTPTHGWAAGATLGNVLYTTDGGQTWAQYNYGNINSINSLYFNSPSDGYAVGGNGMIIYFRCQEVPEILTTTPGETCGEGEVTLMATASAGTIKWYDASTDGTLLGEGGSLAQTITETTSFWVEAEDQGCFSQRIEVVATLKEIPEVLSTTPDETCGEGEVTLMATASAGTIKWYDVETEGTLLGEGGSLTQNITETTSFWVEADDDGCISERVEVIATLNDVPEVLSTTPDEICGEGEVTLSATASAGTMKWYDAETGGTLLGEGGTLTQNITETTSFWVEADYEGCTSERVEVIGTFKEIPEILTINPGETCGTTAVMAVTASAGTIMWYDAEVGGNLLGFGGSLTLGLGAPVTTFWVEVESNGCVSDRVEVGTFYLKPTILSTTPDETCGEGEVTVSATASAGTIKWYDAETGGTLLGEGGSLTQNITETTSFWVESDNEGCASDRVEVVATILPLPDKTVTRVDFLLTANQEGATYKWLDCNNGFAEITGETGPSFTVTQNGSFAVEVTLGQCTLISDCIDIINVGITSPDDDGFKVFPNPTKNIVNIEVAMEIVGSPFSIYDRIGRIVRKGTLNSQNTTVDIGNLPNGVYFFIIENTQKQIKIIKQ